MPDAALHPCLHPRCASYATAAHGYCIEHAKQDKARRTYSKLSPNHRRFRRERHSFLLRHPLCAMCKSEPASILDHRIPHRGNAVLFWDQANWQALCVACHGTKTAREVWHTFADGG